MGQIEAKKQQEMISIVAQEHQILTTLKALLIELVPEASNKPIVQPIVAPLKPLSALPKQPPALKPIAPLKLPNPAQAPKQPSPPKSPTNPPKGASTIKTPTAGIPKLPQLPKLPVINKL